MNSTVLRCKRETAENETKSGAHTWQRDCAHARLVTRDGEIEITVTVARTVGRINLYVILTSLVPRLHLQRFGRWSLGTTFAVTDRAGAT